MTEKRKRRQSPHFGGPDTESVARKSMSSPNYSAIASNGQAAIFDAFLDRVQPLAHVPYTPRVARAVAKALGDLVSDAKALGDLATLRAVAQTDPPDNPLAFEPYYGRGVDRSEFARALARRQAWAALDVALSSPSVAADDALTQATGGRWSRE